MTSPLARDMHAAALTLTGITKRFGRTLALDNVTLRVRTGHVHALLGENGAGKTTLMRVAFGMLQPDAGKIEVAGRSVRLSSPAVALASGMGMVHQHFTLVPAMTVVENVALGGHGMYSASGWAARVREIGERTGLHLDPEARVSQLSVGAQQRCEIVKALARHVRVLILDEPTAVLAPDEARELLQWVSEYATSGHAVVLITHKLRDAMAVASDVTVLRRGKCVLQTTSAETSERALADAMLGGVRRDGADADGTVNANAAASTNTNAIANATVKAIVKATVVIAARNVTVRDADGILRLDSVSLEVCAGEVVGIAAVEGGGQRELVRVLSGRLQPTAGELVAPDNTGFVPEDRHHDALLLDRPLLENVALRDAGLRRRRMPWPQLEDATEEIIATQQVQAIDIFAEARTLSGGNQQKLIVGRELHGAPAALVVENPTRGLDFHATAAVHEALRNASRNGTAVVLYSSDLDEVLALSDRVAVMHSGRVTAVFAVPHDSTNSPTNSPTNATASDLRDAVGRAMLGT